MPSTATSSTVGESAPKTTPAAGARLAHQAIHDTVGGILEKQRRGALLDVPAGEGALAARLIAAGFEVTCCDLYPEIFRLDGVDIRQGDLNGDLPFTDHSVDYVTCLEVLAHID